MTCRRWERQSHCLRVHWSKWVRAHSCAGSCSRTGMKRSLVWRLCSAAWKLVGTTTMRKNHKTVWPPRLMVCRRQKHQFDWRCTRWFRRTEFWCEISTLGFNPRIRFKHSLLPNFMKWLFIRSLTGVSWVLITLIKTFVSWFNTHTSRKRRSNSTFFVWTSRFYADSCGLPKNNVGIDGCYGLGVNQFRVFDWRYILLRICWYILIIKIHLRLYLI